MATRSRSMPPVVYHGGGTLSKNGTELPAWSRSFPIFSHTKSMQDVVVDNYFTRIKQGEVINNPVLIEETVYLAAGGGSMTQTQGSTTYHFSADSLTRYLEVLWHPNAVIIPPVVVDEAQLISLAKAKALGRVDKSAYSFGEAIGEVRETLRFIRNPLRSLHDISYAFKRKMRDVRSGRKASRLAALSKGWLSFRFAAMPILWTVQDAVDATMKKISLEKRRVASAVVRKNYSDSETLLLPISDDVDTFDVSVESEYKVKGYVIYEVSNPLYDWRFKYGLRFSDLPETIWQLQPYSFMIDRVVDISAAIRGLSVLADPSISILGGGTVVEETTSSTKSFLSKSDPGWSTTVSPDSYTETYKRKQREPWEPTISDIISKPDIRGLVSDATKTADLVSLILKNLR